MANDYDALIEETEHHCKVAAAQVARRFRGYVTYADLIQEGYVWVIKHPATAQQRLDDGRRGEQRLVNQLAKHMEKQARKERASSLRYQPEDEAFYQRTLVEAALPAIWDEDLMLKPPDDDNTTEPHRRRSDASETSNWLVTVLDIRSAWEKAEMDLNWRTALAYRYGEGLRVYQIADLLEVSDTTAQTYIDKGVRAIIHALGGTAPGRCPPDCECGEGIGSRRAISNAEARARTDENYG